MTTTGGPAGAPRRRARTFSGNAFRSGFAQTHIQYVEDVRTLVGPRGRAATLGHVDLAALASDVLGPGWPCPGGPHGARTAGVVVHGARWHCPVCLDGGSALDLVSLVGRISAAEAGAQVRAWLVGHQPSAAPHRPADGPPLAPVAVVVADGSQEREVVLESSAAATWSDVAAALGLGGQRLHLRGHPLPPTGLVAGSGLREGDALTLTAVASDPAVTELRWVDGLDAGVVDRLAAGTWLAGASPIATVRRHEVVGSLSALLSADPGGRIEVTPLHASVTPAVEDGSLRIGTSRAIVRTVDATARRVAASRVPAVAGRWTAPLIRPPGATPGVAPTPWPIVADPDDKPAVTATPPAVVPVVVSLVGGVVLAVVADQPLLLLLGGLAAVGSLGTWGWQRWSRWRTRRRQRRAAAAADVEVARLRQRWLDDEVARRVARHPDLATIAERIEGGRAGLWHVRPAGAPLELSVGEAWQRLAPDRGEPNQAPAAEEPDRASLRRAPVAVALQPGSALAVVGPPDAAYAVAWALVLRLAADYGPADLAIVADRTATRWAWTRWLPHTGGPHGDGSLAEAAPAPDRAVILLTDDPAALHVRTGAGRRLLAAGASAIVVASEGDRLPAICDAVLTVASDGVGSLRRSASPDLGPVTLAGVAAPTASRLARCLAGYHDPEVVDAASELPDVVHLPDLLGPTAADPAAMVAAWRTATPGTLSAPVAIAADGVVEVDLVRDGPHVLIAGTTGAGKSELLRSLVVGLASRHRPDDVGFLLIDYKGGSAFDACTRLPHVVGVVTDLDANLGERALRSLHAELRRREGLLRQAGAADIEAYTAVPRAEPLARLVVIIDEFATLAAELPDLLRAIVGVAQRGRSLGVHLVLATQRPGAAVSDDVRANTNLHICLRVQQATESVDVIGVPDAAALAKDRPGRAVIRWSSADHLVVQAAAVTAASERAGSPAVRVRSLDDRAEARPRAGVGGLHRLVDVVNRAALIAGSRPPARPWLPPLPAVVPLADLPAGAVGLIDDPDAQVQRPLAWDPDRGHLLVIGRLGSGGTTALAAIALDLARSCSLEDVHLLVADLGDGALAPLEGLPHVGAVVQAGEGERLERLVRLLHHELERRQAGEGGTTWLVVLIDGLPALRAALDEPTHRVLDDLDAVLADGPRHRIVVAATTERLAAIPLSLASGIAQRWALQPADPADRVSFGVRAADAPPWSPGRAIVAESRLEAQVAWPGALDAAVAELRSPWPAPRNCPPTVGTLPRSIDATALAPPTAGPPLRLPVGVADADLGEATIELHAGEHLLVAGPARSGRSSALVLLAAQLRRVGGAQPIVALTPRPSPLAEVTGLDVVATSVEELVSACGQRLLTAGYLLVDDADLVDDGGDRLAAMLAGRSGWQLLVAGRPEALRSGYGHWTQLVRRSRLGLLLQPDPLVDGDLLGVVLPRHRRVARVPGRGYLVAEGAAELVQVARWPILVSSPATSLGPGPRDERPSVARPEPRQPMAAPRRSARGRRSSATAHGAAGLAP